MSVAATMMSALIPAPHPNHYYYASNGRVSFFRMSLLTIAVVSISLQALSFVQYHNNDGHGVTIVADCDLHATTSGRKARAAAAAAGSMIPPLLEKEQEEGEEATLAEEQPSRQDQVVLTEDEAASDPSKEEETRGQQEESEEEEEQQQQQQQQKQQEDEGEEEQGEVDEDDDDDAGKGDQVAGEARIVWAKEEELEKEGGTVDSADADQEDDNDNESSEQLVKDDEAEEDSNEATSGDSSNGANINATTKEVKSYANVTAAAAVLNHGERTKNSADMQSSSTLVENNDKDALQQNESDINESEQKKAALMIQSWKSREAKKKTQQDDGLTSKQRHRRRQYQAKLARDKKLGILHKSNKKRKSKQKRIASSDPSAPPPEQLNITKTPPVPLNVTKLNITDTSIRSWGCARNETPFIFVHIGKAGGGGVRSRFAASALDYNRSAWHRLQEDTSYYYPIWQHFRRRRTNNEPRLHRGAFASSSFNSFRPQHFSAFDEDLSFEGTGNCGAATPLGKAIACPLERAQCQDRDGDGDKSRCDLIYMGHNTLGNEMHWLPTDFLVKWWKTTKWANTAEGAKLKTALENRQRFDKPFALENIDIAAETKPPRLSSQERVRKRRRKEKGNGCPANRVDNFNVYMHAYEKCMQPREALADKVARQVVLEQPGETGTELDFANQWGPIYASLPVVRVTVMREPFSWLMSKFFWHSRQTDQFGQIRMPYESDRKTKKVRERFAAEGRPDYPLLKCDDMDAAAKGWAAHRARLYVIYLCGEHCFAGFDAAQRGLTADDGGMTLDQMEAQAAYNLRNSFAVVGLLHKTDEFYDMVSRRVFYIDTSLNSEVKGKRHGTATNGEPARCKNLYNDPSFQQQLVDQSPEVAALYRLYQVALEVNAFQTNELQQCTSIGSE